ncbi:hypothetical protein Pmani_006229 [Petrolisthes manimaculis]|uniref:Uncharacterized protein n=1 Tax=Petrolisthes manimaculis TaxID=1843537 RepID=A0AAE1ULB5_9EUCA|nr:hypothetical protein Pmani_006229 [Petrolisthes manimaculis]
MENVTRKQVPGLSQQNSITQQYMNITGKQKIPLFELQPDITQQYTNTTGKPKIHHFEQQKSTTQQLYSTNTTATSGSCCMNVAMTFPYHPSPRKTLIQGVVLRQTNKAFRSHRLFPLLKDLAITDHYYMKNVFTPLISYLPESTDELVSLYLKRHPKSTSTHESDWHSPALDAVILDAVKYTHRSLLEKITLAADPVQNVGENDTLVEELCGRYCMKALHSSTPLHNASPQSTKYDDDDEETDDASETGGKFCQSVKRQIRGKPDFGKLEGC